MTSVQQGNSDAAAALASSILESSRVSFPRESCDAVLRVRALLLRCRCHMQLRNNDDARRDADEAAAWGGGARADVARALAYERYRRILEGDDFVLTRC